MGRLVKGKGYEVLLKGIAELAPPDQPNLLLAGDGGECQKLEDLAAGLGITQQAKFLAFQSDVRPILWAADIFVHVPTTFPEGTPNAVLEAMAAGLPVIATPVGGIGEIVRHGETGWLVPPNDASALAEALRHLRADSSLRRRLGETAQAFVREHHSVGALAERILQVYATLLGKQLWTTLR